MRSLLPLVLLAACGGSKTPSPAPPVEPPKEAPKEAPKAVEAEKPVEAAKPDPKAELLAAETSAWDTAKPVFTKYCASCHTKAGKKTGKKKLDHFDMDAYPLGGHHAAAIGFTIRDVLGISGKKATMPDDKPGSVKGDELAAIKAWTDAWEAAEKAGAHPPHGTVKDDD